MRACLGVVLLLGLGASCAAAQNRGECTFDTCALRVQHRFSGPPRVVRGLGAEPVATLGLFGNSLAEVVAMSDSAVTYARAGNRQGRAATVWGIVGLVGVTAAVLDYTGSFRDWRDPSAVMYVSLGVGFSAAMIAGWQRTRSLDSVEMAIWWYNRDLATGDAY